ncbi:hypothetical protein G7K_2838-t1 [Saitoella complicata NRRL Y-17804]|uniref:Uncharacterized protein n=1 Tax=Saitoella complicata (strain BCRC 22490 / CBS 7301 / JCM 7358 / NBRC 10748 / NRRL Y-17804) TaxID=698492 RepID=A0A0E9NFS6_SAICN|nr:hypothetical protein G7K_2838-t1 [Saitoella complicata NRRL Y-17804]
MYNEESNESPNALQVLNFAFAAGHPDFFWGAREARGRSASDSRKGSSKYFKNPTPEFCQVNPASLPTNMLHAQTSYAAAAGTSRTFSFNPPNSSTFISSNPSSLPYTGGDLTYAAPLSPTCTITVLLLLFPASSTRFSSSGNVILISGTCSPETVVVERTVSVLIANA